MLPGHWKSAGGPISLPRAPLWYLYVAGCQLCEFGFKVLLLPLRTHINVPGHGGGQQTHPLDRKQETPSLGGGFNAVNKAGGYQHPDLTKELRWECLGMAKPGRIWWLSLRLGPALASSFLTPHSKDTLSSTKKKGNHQMLQDRHPTLDMFNCSPRGVLLCPSTLWSSGQP